MVDQTKTVALSQMFNHVPLHIHWMHLLNTRIYRYTYLIPTAIFCNEDRYVMKLFNLDMDSTVFKARCVSHKISDTNYSFLYLLSLVLIVKVLEKIIARTLCFMHQGILSSFYIYNNDAFFF